MFFAIKRPLHHWMPGLTSLGLVACLFASSVQGDEPKTAPDFTSLPELMTISPASPIALPPITQPESPTMTWQHLDSVPIKNSFTDSHWTADPSNDARLEASGNDAPGNDASGIQPQPPPSTVTPIPTAPSMAGRFPVMPAMLQEDLPAPSPSILFGTGGVALLPDNNGPTQAASFGSGVGVDFYSEPLFEGGLLIRGTDAVLKIGGYVKTDFIYDFDPIDSPDTFITTEIPVGAPPRTNYRIHARQTRLSLDTRWRTGGETLKMYVEADFFSDGDRLRLRHAYGNVGEFTIGHTWTAFTDVAAAPRTLDFEGSVSSVNRRKALIRWKRILVPDHLSWSLSIEDALFVVETLPSVLGESRSPVPDLVTNLRYTNDWTSSQVAVLFREGGFQPLDQQTVRGDGWGVNLTSVVALIDEFQVYSQILVGDGIGSFRSLPDAVYDPSFGTVTQPLFGWMVGCTVQWSEKYSSNFTYAENTLDTQVSGFANDVAETSYLAANLIWSPAKRVYAGVEYLYGTRQNADGASADANRLQFSIVCVLP